MEDHRRQIRRRVLKGGRILFNNKASSIDCVVRNQSDGGALLVVQSAVGIPSQFTLVMSDGHTEACITRFKSANAIGVEFRTPSRPSQSREDLSSSPTPVPVVDSPTVRPAPGSIGGPPLGADLRSAAVRLREIGKEEEAGLMDRAADVLSFDGDSRRDAWAAMSMIHEAVGLVVTPGDLPSEESINALYGSTFSAYAHAICETLAKAR